MAQLTEREAVARVRAFNRRWTEILGLLDRGLLDTDRSLAEARVLYELAQRGSCERVELRDRLGMDASFLTRVVTRLQTAGLVTTHHSPVDRRRRRIELTPAGRAAAAELDERSSTQVAELLTSLAPPDRQTLLEALVAAARVVDHAEPPPVITIRRLGVGDLGWMVQRHGELYAAEFGWDESFEALVARIVADFATDPRPGREAGWIAEVDGVRAGCVLCCQRDERTAQLRILLVEPWARGLGLGRRLVEECIAFARAAGYAAILLWTNDVLVAARRIYEAAGFQLIDASPHHSFGHDLNGQTWHLDLAPGPGMNALP